MKIKELLTEDADLINVIKKDCSIFLDYARKVVIPKRSMLYRGLEKRNDEFFTDISPTNRPTLSSLRIMQKLFDTGLQLLGFKALRSNSIFCVSNDFHASGYGNLYMIFPIDGFSYTYTDRKDLVLRDGVVDTIIDMNDLIKDAKAIIWQIKENMNPEVFKELFFQNFFLNEIIRDEKIIAYLVALYMIKTNDRSFYSSIQDKLFPYSKELEPLTALASRLEEYVNPKRMLSEYQPSRTDLNEAMDSGREVLIHGKYHAIRFSEDTFELIYNNLIDQENK